MQNPGKGGIKKSKEAAKLVFCNWKPLAEFELLYKLAAGAVFVPLLAAAFNLAMKIAGYSYLTLENVISFALKPATILIVAGILLLAAIYCMVDISAVVFALDQSVQNKKVGLRQIIIFAAANSIRIWRKQNVLIVPVVLLMLPLVNIGLASGFLSAISIPEFIMEFIEGNTTLLILVSALALGLTALSVRWMYAFFYFTLEKCSFKEACKKSAALGKGRKFSDFLWFLFMQAVIYAAAIGISVVLILAAFFLGDLISGIVLIGWIGSTAVWITVMAILIVAAALSVPFGYGCVGILYYNNKAASGEPAMHSRIPQVRNYPRLAKLTKGFAAACGCILAAVCLFYGYQISAGKINPNIEYVRTMEITAHRGASVFYPENTMAAFEGASKLGADWAELDVQQSRDGQIFVLHDTNFKRTTGVDANTWEMDYEDIAKLDNGSFFGPEFAGERIPLLSEVLDFAKKNDLRLNIELKPTGYETNFEKSVIDLIREYDFAGDCVITSQVYEVLENVKALDPTITTVYVMSLAYGDINQLTAADHFSLESMNVSESMVSSVHNAGKQLYVWTVNTKESITAMIEMGVDNIITDNIELARTCVTESRYSSLLEEFLKILK